jgi:hypothetical protein
MKASEVFCTIVGAYALGCGIGGLFGQAAALIGALIGCCIAIVLSWRDCRN